jgi:hypothetical protein
MVIHHFFCQADWYASVYCLGATGPLAEYAVKRYASHQIVSAQDLTKARQEKAKHDSMLKEKLKQVP